MTAHHFSPALPRLRHAGLLACLGSLLLSGCTGLALTVVNVPAAFGDYTVTRGLSYAASMEGPDASHRLDVYRPRAAAATSAKLRPLVVFFYGGRWHTGSRGQYRFVAAALTRLGYVVVVPEYRLYPQTRFPGFVEDAAQAVAWSRRHAREYGGDPDRLFLMGHSAGAHIAAMLNYDERYLQAVGGGHAWIRGFIGLAGPYDFLPLTDPLLEEIFAPPARYALSQPINFVTGDAAPALLLHGRADETVRLRNSEHLAARIRERGGRVTEHYFDGMSHSGILAAMSVYYRKRRTVLAQIDRFVQAQESDLPSTLRFEDVRISRKAR